MTNSIERLEADYYAQFAGDTASEIALAPYAGRRYRIDWRVVPGFADAYPGKHYQRMLWKRGREIIVVTYVSRDMSRVFAKIEGKPYCYVIDPQYLIEVTDAK
jgi:hypothetical protein